jgi:hypothetical protein
MIARTQPTAATLSARVDAALAKPPVIPAPKPGVYEHIPSEVYHAWDALSNSMIGHLRRSPAHLRAYLLSPSPETPALRLGRALHCAILEPERFAIDYTVASPCVEFKKSDGLHCTNAGITLHDDGWRCGQHNKKAGPADESKLALSEGDHETCLGVLASIRQHPAAGAMFESEGRVELSVVWKDDETGILCKARFDKHAPDISTGLLIDPKSTTDASNHAFEKSVRTYGYHIQGAHYLTGAQAVGLQAHHFANVAFEKDAPFAVAVYRIHDTAIQIGEMLRRPLIRLYAQCRDRNEWPAYPGEVQDIYVPDFALQSTEDEVRAIGGNYGIRVEDIIGASAARARIARSTGTTDYEVIG